MRRALLVPAGVLLAFTASSLVLVGGAAILVTGAPVETSQAMVTAAAAWVVAAQAGSEPGSVALRIGAALSWTLISVGLGPIAIAAGLGEVTRRRGLLALSAAAGLLAVAGPLVWIVGRETGRPVALDGSGRVFALLFLSGVVSGATYWVIAGSPGARPEP